MSSAWLRFVLLAPIFAFSCAQGNTLGIRPDQGGDQGSGGSGSGEVENEPDPGSSDPGTGASGQGGSTGAGDVGEDCAHDPCFPGVALDPNCHPCVWDVCQADPYCCMTGWNQQCADEAAPLCACPNSGGGGSDSGSGGAGPGTGGTDPGIGGSDPGIGGSDPGGTGGGGPIGGTCDHGLCETGPVLDSSCDPCVDTICSADDYCCSVEWDVFCVFAAFDTCPEACL